MKNISILFAFLISFSYSSYCLTNVPSSILKIQSTKYPKASNLRWERGKDVGYTDSVYLALFELNGKGCSVRYDINGNAIEIREGIDSKSLPNIVIQRINSMCPQYKFDNITKVFVKRSEIQYQPYLKNVSDYYDIFLSKGKDSYKLYFSLKGVLLNNPELKSIK